MMPLVVVQMRTEANNLFEGLRKATGSVIDAMPSLLKADVYSMPANGSELTAIG